MSDFYLEEEEKSKQIKIGKERVARDILETIEKRKGSSNMGTLTRIYSYCKKIISSEPQIKGRFGKHYARREK